MKPNERTPIKKRGKRHLERFTHKFYITFSLFFKLELQNHAGAVAYFFLLSITPLLLIFVHIFDSYLDAYPDFSEQFFILLSSFYSRLDYTFLEKIGIVNISLSALGVFGLLNLLWISRLIVGAVQRSFGIIFTGEKSRKIVVDGITSFVIVPLIFLGVGLAVLTNVLFKVIEKLAAESDFSSDFVHTSTQVLSHILPFAIAFIIIYLSYRYLPANRPSLKAAFQGSIFCAISIYVIKIIFTEIFSVTHISFFYGFIGSLILTLIWVYVVSLFYFYFALFTHVADRLDLLVVDKMFSHNSVVKPKSRKRIGTFLIKRSSSILEKYTRIYNSGDIIFSKGDPSQTTYYIYSGSVGLYRGSGKDLTMLSTVKSEEIFGEMAYLLGEKRTATAIAEEESVIFIFPPQMFEELLDANTALSRQTIRMLCARLNSMNDRSDGFS